MNTLINEREGALELIARGINAGAWDWNFTNGSCWWSPRYCKLLGYQPNEMNCDYQSFVSKRIHPDDKQSFEEAINHHIATDLPLRTELRLLTKDGSYRWFELSGAGSKSEDGVLRRMSGVIMDRHEDILLRQRLALSEYLLQETGRIGKIAGWQFKVGTNEAYMTPIGYEIYGFEEHKLPPVEERQKLIDPEHLGEMQRRLSESIEKGIPYEMEHRLILPDGTRKWVYAKGEPVYSPIGKVEYMRGITRDITEQKRKEEELMAAAALVKQQNNKLLTFARVISHDLTSHSANLMRVTEIFEDADSREEELEMAELIRKISGSLVDTIKNLAQLVKAQTEVEQHKTLLNLEQVYSKVLTVLSPEIKQRKAVINTDFSACPEVEYVLPYLESILLNFTTNALKYSHPNRRPEINLCSATLGGRVVIEISDNGLGIDLERYGKDLFGLYKTFHGNIEARGIGLFVTKSQVDSLGGTIEVQSRPDQGTTFKVML